MALSIKGESRRIGKMIRKYGRQTSSIPMIISSPHGGIGKRNLEKIEFSTPKS
jgi:hypothetical protein